MFENARFEGEVSKPVLWDRQRVVEKAYKSSKCDGVARGFKLATVDVDGIAQGLECIETYSNRQDDVQRRRMHLYPHSSPCFYPAFYKKISVLKIGKQSKICHQRDR